MHMRLVLFFWIYRYKYLYRYIYIHTYEIQHRPIFWIVCGDLHLDFLCSSDPDHLQGQEYRRHLAQDAFDSLFGRLGVDRLRRLEGRRDHGCL